MFRSLGILLATVLATQALGTDLLLKATASEPLNLNDVSFLWPLPKTSEDHGKLISVDEKAADGTLFWPQSDFDRVIAAAPQADAGESDRIVFPPNESIEKLSAWKIAGIRIDPSAPGCDPAIQALFGQNPQIRLIVQPVHIKNVGLRIHDITAHLVYDFVKSPGVPDREKFGEIAKDLAAIKTQLAAKNITTDDKLGVHPGFADPAVDLTGVLREFLKKHLSAKRLNTIAFMGVRRPEPWLFFVMRRGNDGVFSLPPQPSAQQLLMEFVTPFPKNKQFGDFGVSTADLFAKQGELDAEIGLAPIAALGRKLFVREISDVIASPKFSHVLNTDCVSCHTESSLRGNFGLPAAPPASPLAALSAGVKPECLPSDHWNVRNFGWGVGRGNNFQATATMRTANEAAESAHFINHKYLSAAPAPAAGSAHPAHDPTTGEPGQVSHPLTLVMKAKNADEYKKLKAKLTGLQNQPPAENPLRKALEDLEKVHFARFVFLDESETMMVITSFDDDFDDYVDLFVDKIGHVFDMLLIHIKDAPRLPVGENRDAFLEFVKKHDVPSIGGLYSAYPKLRAAEIRRLAKP